MMEKDVESHEELLKIRDLYHSMYTSTPAMLHSINRVGEIISVSDFWLKKLGYTRDEVIGKKSTAFLTEESKKYANEVVLPAFFESGTCIDVSYQWIKKDGAIMDVLLSSTSEKNEKNEIVRSLAILVDVTEKLRVEKQLQESEKKYRAIFNSLTDIYFRTDANGMIEIISPVVEKIMGYKPEDVIGKKDVMIYSQSYDRESLIKKLNNHGFVKNHLISGVHKNGAGLIFELNATVVLDEQGDYIGYDGVLRDISEKERALKKLKEKDVLLKEVHHRVKNNLQIVSSLLSLQLSNIEEKELYTEVFETSQRRIAAIALVHEKLYQTVGMNEIYMLDYVEDLVSKLSILSYNRQHEVKVELDIESSIIELERAVPLGLILNEALTNSYKYAFVNISSPQIKISCTRKNDIRILTISDNGVGIKSIDEVMQSDSLGMKLIRSLTRQIRGELKIDSSLGKGTTITIKF